LHTNIAKKSFYSSLNKAFGAVIYDWTQRTVHKRSQN
jgi:hypothetical protein